ncbi:Fungal specific transcription factor domain-containing protein isoform 3 [Cladophialophora immunda]|nr:Fungal specific transcription factor domain-containing protein isoform 1 [Cladophialophora immunda]OQV00981.1 Fungal specific transcription factor domain-containing protein isoform 2 [Cladophialophora immunda]OQV00982.1 Fungal specific transcription factor domain-containing protein isoform 3 [Cladophialophora immunda]
MGAVEASLVKNVSKQCFVLPARRPKKHADNDRTAMLESRMTRMETLIQSRQDSASSNAGVHLGPDPASVARTNPPAALSSIVALDGAPEGNENLSADATCSQRVAVHPWQDSVNVQEQITIAPHKANWEHMGPSSWITICSPPGLKWVAERSGTNALAECAKDLTLSWSQRLKFAGLQHRDDSPEPDAQTAWLYTKAYFEDSLEALYGVVYRPEFEARLHDHLNSRGINCPTWHALRNVVYATGCRTYLAKQKSSNWSDAQRQSWVYFENALSVYVDLLYTPSGLTAVRALAAMNLHVEGAGNAALESVMCASAVRLAQTKGLHREPPSSWGLSQDEALHRKWLWWAIYIHERQVTHRSGRPSTIDEDNISCQIPTTVVTDSTIDLSFMTAMVHHARISAQICRKLLSVSGFRQSPPVNMERMAELSQQLETWKTSLPDHLKPAAIDPSAFRSVREMNRTLCVHFAYYGSITAINTIFFYPWISYACGIDPRNLAHTHQIVESTKVVAEAARDIIHATRVISTDATSPQW